jgi:hypothetical protein
MTFWEVAGVGVGVVATVSPVVWPKMKTIVSYPIAMGGFLVLGYSGILLWQEQSGMKVDTGPTVAILLGMAIVIGGILWQTSKNADSAPTPQKNTPHGPEPERTLDAPRMGDINTDNSGIITKDQKGDNVIKR